MPPYFSSLYGLQKTKNEPQQAPAKHHPKRWKFFSSRLKNLKANDKGNLEWEILGYVSNVANSASL